MQDHGSNQLKKWRWAWQISGTGFIQISDIWIKVTNIAKKSTLSAGPAILKDETTHKKPRVEQGIQGSIMCFQIMISICHNVPAHHVFAYWTTVQI